jgi:hypothetical protein
MTTRLSALFIALAAATAHAVGAASCSQETLSVQGSPVTIEYCVSGAPRAADGAEMIVPVTETYSAPGGSMRRSVQLHFLAGEGVSRVLQSLDLTMLGLTGTLHLTLAYSRGLVHIEGALLVPGAITIK